MRNLLALEAFRIPNTPYDGGAFGGAFLIPYPLAGEQLKCIASAGEGWDHVSVSLQKAKRTPNWAEMEYAKRTFFHPGEIAWEYHMNTDDHISIHPYVLHIWRKHDFKMPVPPKVFV